MLKKISIALFILSLTVSTSFAIESFECKAKSSGHGFCKGGTVSIGAIKGKIIMACGQPDSDTVISKSPKLVEHLFYYRDLDLRLTLENRKLTKIEKIEKKTK